MGEMLISVGQALIILLVCPLINGIIKTAKARMQRRRGPRVIQPYFDIIKFLHREAVSSPNSSWITAVTPYIYFSAFLVAASIIPVSGHQGLMLGDIIVFIYLFALARFFSCFGCLGIRQCLWRDGGEQRDDDCFFSRAGVSCRTVWDGCSSRID